MPETYHVVPEAVHNQLVEKAYRRRGYDAEECADAARFCASAAAHGIRTHNAIKGLHLDHVFGSTIGGCVPGAQIREIPGRFKAAQVWDAGRKLGQSVAYRAMERCMRLADEYGVGTVSVDNCFHYLWGGGYVMEAAKKGYIAYTCCTAMLAEVVPFGGKTPTLGTNPHSWAFPTTAAIGFPIVIDWATSTVAMGRVQQFQREGRPLPPNVAVDKDGNPTTDPNLAVALLPFGAHKGYGLALIDELWGAMIGGSLPTLRGRPPALSAAPGTVTRAERDSLPPSAALVPPALSAAPGTVARAGRDSLPPSAAGGSGGAALAPPDSMKEKHAPVFFFQVIHPEAVSGGAFARGRTQAENVEAVIRDILGQGNEACILPGQLEAEAAALSARHGGLLFTPAEMDAFADIARECGEKPWDSAAFKTVSS